MVGWICACHLPGSIYVVYRVLDNQLEGSRWLFTVLLMIIELTLIFTSLLTLAKFAKTTALTQRCLPAAQQLILADRPNLKLKYLCLYERLNNETLFGVTIGFLNSISYKTIFEVTSTLFCCSCSFLITFLFIILQTFYLLNLSKITFRLDSCTLRTRSFSLGCSSKEKTGQINVCLLENVKSKTF